MCLPCLPVYGLERPKSMRKIGSRPVAKFSAEPSFERQKLAGLMSLWMIPYLCTSYIILIIYLPKLQQAYRLKIIEDFFYLSCTCIRSWPRRSIFMMCRFWFSKETYVTSPWTFGTFWEDFNYYKLSCSMLRYLDSQSALAANIWPVDMSFTL